jgi:hypothetical protein
MEVIQFNPNENFFNQLPYDIVCHIFKFICTNYDEKILEINYDRFNYIINEDKYINKFRPYRFGNYLIFDFNTINNTEYEKVFVSEAFFETDFSSEMRTFNYSN